MQNREQMTWRKHNVDLVEMEARNREQHGGEPLRPPAQNRRQLRQGDRRTKRNIFKHMARPAPNQTVGQASLEAGQTINDTKN
jgi:hypothetical protein